MATITSQSTLPNGAGVFTQGNLNQINSNITTANSNTTALNTQIGAGAVYHAKYSFATDGGAVSTITPAVNVTIPANFVIQNVALNSTTAVTSSGSATVAVGLSAGGSGTASLVAATAKASWSANAFVQGVPVPQTASTWIKMSAAGSVTVTVATAALTAGVIEVYIFGYQSAS